MKNKFLFYLFLILNTQVAFASSSQEVNDLFISAIESEYNDAYSGNTQTAASYFSAVLQRDPNNIRAKFELLFLDLWVIRVANLMERTRVLASRGAQIKSLFEECEARKDFGLLHFMKAIYANFYNDFIQAQNEIELAVKHDPSNAEYLFWKGRILSDYGDWLRDDNLLEKGVLIIEKAKSLAKKSNSNILPYYIFDWQKAVTYADFTASKDKEIIENYESVILQLAGKKNSRLAFAYHNASSTLYKAGNCKKAVEYEEKALKIMNFNNAEAALELAKICLKIQNTAQNNKTN